MVVSFCSPTGPTDRDVDARDAVCGAKAAAAPSMRARTSFMAARTCAGTVVRLDANRREAEGPSMGMVLKLLAAITEQREIGMAARDRHFVRTNERCMQ